MKGKGWLTWTALCLALPAVMSAQRHSEDRDDDRRGRQGDLTEERGYDRRGNDYTSFRARSLDDCQDSCRREGRCRAYTFDTRNGDCYLKDRVNSGERNGVMVTGYKEERRDRPDWDDEDRRVRLSEEPGRDRKGNDYTSFRVRDLRECKRECRHDDRCRAYTFIESSRRCYLKSRINSGVRNRDAVTGYKEGD